MLRNVPLCTEPQKQLWSYRVNLDKRVRSDHPLRKLNDVLKLDFVRGEVAKFYGIKGNVSEDPAAIMKMMLLLFLDDVRSERELMRIIPERLDYMWFLGYGLDDTMPDHSILSKARKRWGQEVFVSTHQKHSPAAISTDPGKLRSRPPRAIQDKTGSVFVELYVAAARSLICLQGGDSPFPRIPCDNTQVVQWPEHLFLHYELIETPQLA
ncbi:MAG TPA: transposase [Steroidobacteraceae bacterium]|nr:transposase [Steroidobacteraceae bacterium]